MKQIQDGIWLHKGFDLIESDEGYYAQDYNNKVDGTPVHTKNYSTLQKLVDDIDNGKVKWIKPKTTKSKAVYSEPQYYGKAEKEKTNG